ncbi:translocation protein [Hyaloraphidium curvatum]|nr:translocation protein [Hyaloraphidium curvatum]
MAAAHPPGALEAANFLRSKDSKVRCKDGVMDGRRIEYFKGKSAVKALLLPAYAGPKRPPVKSADEAADLLNQLLHEGLFVRADKIQPKGRYFRPVPHQTFHPDGYYVWIYQGSQWKTYLIGSGLIAIALAGVMFPLWPVQLRVGVWYISVTLLALLGVFFGMVLVRFLLYIATTLVYRGQGLWIFPRLFDDLSIVESFQPFYEWELSKEEKELLANRARSDAEEDGEEAGDAASGTDAAQTTAAAPADEGAPANSDKADGKSDASPAGTARRRKNK